MLIDGPWDDRRHLIIPGDEKATLIFCLHHFITIAIDAIEDHGAFYVALSGGSTPKMIFEHLTRPPYVSQIDWEKVHLFFSDERSVPPTHPDSNYRMAMEAGFKKVGIPHIHRMCAEENIEKNALAYEELIGKIRFDLIMLGMGEDGHTASLFPKTDALNATDRLILANFVPQKNSWRLTMTFKCINQAFHIAVYVLGQSKNEMLAKVLCDPSDPFPASRVGTATHKALWIVDESASSLLQKQRKQHLK